LVRCPASERRSEGRSIAARGLSHFHEDPTGLFADVRFEDDFERLRVTTPKEQDVFL